MFGCALQPVGHFPDVWYTSIHSDALTSRRKGSIGVTAKFTKIQRMATFAMCASATDSLDLHVNLLPVDVTLHKACHRATVRMSTLPSTHPLHTPVRHPARRYVKTHRSPLHHLTHIYQIHPDSLETIDAVCQRPTYQNAFTTQIAPTRDKSIEEDRDLRDPIKLYSDGSGYEGGVGVAAALIRRNEPPKILKYHLGALTAHTVYEGKAVGVTLALELLRQDRNANSPNSVSIDNQAVITATHICKPRASHYLVDQVHLQATALLKELDDNYLLTIRWISGHSRAEGNELVDEEAKKAAQGESSLVSDLPHYLRSGPLPASSTVVKQEFKKELHKRWAKGWVKSPRYAWLQKVDPSMPSTNYQKLVCPLSRAQMSLLTQLRTGHIGLNKHLNRINRAESPNCPHCPLIPETVHHFLHECPRYRHERFKMCAALRHHTSDTSFLLSHPKGVKHLLAYVGSTGRLKPTFGKLSKS